MSVMLPAVTIPGRPTGSTTAVLALDVAYELDGGAGRGRSGRRHGIAGGRLVAGPALVRRSVGLGHLATSLRMPVSARMPPACGRECTAAGSHETAISRTGRVGNA